MKCFRIQLLFCKELFVNANNTQNKINLIKKILPTELDVYIKKIIS